MRALPIRPPTPHEPRPPDTMRTTRLFVPAALLSALAAGALAFNQEEAPAGERLGAGDHVYAWVPGWGALPEGQVLGNTHGCIVNDSAGRIYVNTDTERAMMVFSPDGELVDSWGAELKGGLHGTCIVAEENEAGEVEEFLYLTHLGRHEVLKTTLAGEVLWTLPYPEASGHYQNANEYRPTSVCVAPDGRIFVADGYGKSVVHRYDADRNYLGSFGGYGTEPGQMRTPHGIWLDTRAEEPRLLVADRENNRLQLFDLEGEHLEVIAGDLRRPCHAHQKGDDLLVADLAGRVTILGADNQLITHLGDQPDPGLRAQNGVPLEKWLDGQFLSPHCARWDEKGDVYVMDWNARGRVSKLERVE